MKSYYIHALLACALLLALTGGEARGQSIKTNVPLLLMGSPNIGAEVTLTRQLTLDAEALWMPYMFKKHEEVFRAATGSIECRYHVSPSHYYTNDSWDGFYVGPYALYGQFNIGLFRHGDKDQSVRRKGWGVSGGLSTGYKFYLSPRFKIDINLGLGYAHLQYNKYKLGGEYAGFPMEQKATKAWFGPTKFGVYLVYNIFR
ncbi:MAG: DUF3575 domain-containing protein [Odoribacteraceae bacterium]|jgi:hypothetical protein|nr:DUF3575 domain-containing protein [Odoribacteraceae bacterium]